VTFCPGNWSSIYTNQMGQLQQEEIGCFEDMGAKVTGISVDSLWSHRAWSDERGIAFPLLSDSQRHLVEDYGAKHEAGFPERTYFVVDERGVVRAKKIEESPSDQPEIEVVLENLEKAF
jgi:peroxiredoxin